MDGELDGTPPLPKPLPPLPESVADFVSIDRETSTIFVETKRLADPLLLTWLDRCRASGVLFTKKPVSIDELRLVQQTQQTTTNAVIRTNEAALENRDAAIAILRRAAHYRATDIHIRLLGKGQHCEITYRNRGDLGIAEKIRHEDGDAIIRSFFTSIATDKEPLFVPGEVQKAGISGDILKDTGLANVRITRGPSYPEDQGGGFMILRLQYSETFKQPTDTPTGKPRDYQRSPATLKIKLPPLKKPPAPAGVLNLPNMGYTPQQDERLRFIVEAPSGMTIFTGPTGSGKTTSIYELLKEVARRWPGKRIVAIEDPIEYPMRFAIQLVITEALDGRANPRDMFAEYLSIALRMDPDTIFLGELRTVEAFLAAVQAAMTGHRVPTTTHLDDPYNIADRFEIMDPNRLPRRMFCNSKIIRGIINQRLINRVCPHCSIRLTPKYEPEIEPRLMSVLRTYGNLADVRLRGEGCEECNYETKRDRIAVAEVIATDQALMIDLVEHGADTARRNFRARSDTDPSVLGATMDRVLLGEIDPRDVSQSVDVIVPKDQVDA